MASVNLSPNILELIEKDKNLLKWTINEEFKQDDIGLNVKMSPSNENCILYDEDSKMYTLYLAPENIVSFKSRENMAKAIIRHERGHVEFLKKENIFSPHAAGFLKKFFGVYASMEVDTKNNIKIITQNRLIDGKIFMSDDNPVMNGLLDTYVEEQLESVTNMPPSNSPLFPSTILDMMQKVATIRFAKNRGMLFGRDYKDKTKMVSRAFHRELKGKVLRFSNLQSAIDECYNILIDAKDYKSSWRSLNHSFNNFMEIL